MEQFARSKAVITGAASGLGRAFALELSKLDAHLLISDVNEAKLAETAQLCREAGAQQVETFRLDVRDAGQVEAMKKAAVETLGAVDLLINNAGVAVTGAIGEASLEDWRWQIDINLWGVIYGCHFFAPMMKTAGKGTIINVASAAGLLSSPEMAPYNVTKSGVVALSRSLFSELRAAGVHVTVLCPTFFQSSIADAARHAGTEQQARAKKLIAKSKWTAEAVARFTLEGAARGRLHLLPQTDARIFWFMQRLWPMGAQRLVTYLYNSDRTRNGGSFLSRAFLRLVFGPKA